MTFRINPRQASIDIDCMSVSSFRIEDSTESDGPRPISLHLNLTGGIGRISIEGLGDALVDDTIEVEASGDFPQMTSSQRDELSKLVVKWQELSVPLRFLVFSEKAVILEDSDEFIILPPGVRRVTVGTE